MFLRGDKADTYLPPSLLPSFPPSLRGLADDAFFLLRPGESWEVGTKREGFLEHFKEEERRPLSH